MKHTSLLLSVCGGRWCRGHFRDVSYVFNLLLGIRKALKGTFLSDIIAFSSPVLVPFYSGEVIQWLNHLQATLLVPVRLLVLL